MAVTPLLGWQLNSVFTGMLQCNFHWNNQYYIFPYCYFYYYVIVVHSFIYLFSIPPCSWPHGHGGLLEPIQGRKHTTWKNRQLILGPHREKQPFAITFPLTDNLESPGDLTCMFLDWGRRPQNPERAHTDTGQTPHRKVQGPGSNQQPSFCLILLLLRRLLLLLLQVVVVQFKSINSHTQSRSPTQSLYCLGPGLLLQSNACCHWHMCMWCCDGDPEMMENKARSEVAQYLL